MNKSLVLAVALALPMMAYSLPAFSASHAKAGGDAGKYCDMSGNKISE